MACTVWDFLEALTKYDGSDSAHEDVIKDLNGFGHHATMKDAWCTETLMAAMHRAGGIDLIGGYAQTSGTLKKNAQKKGIWHGGTNGILPGDILVFGSSGKPNHTEANVGFYIDVAGNYNGGCGRRSYKGRSVIGYVRPKYKGMPDMTNLQIAIAAADCILNVYSSGDTRKKQLTVFGKKNSEKIQDEVDRVWNDIDKTVFDLAVYVIANHAGKGKYRRKRLGNWATAVQDKIDGIYALKGRTNAEAAQLVLQDKFGTNAIRELLLKFCGYDPAAVQKEVNKALKQPAAAADASVSGRIISLFRDKDRSTKEIDGLQGDLVIVKDDAKSALIMDAFKTGAMDRIKEEIKDCDRVDLYISHPHSDHMSSNANALVKAKRIKRCYVPAESTIAGEYKKRYKTLLDDCKKYGTEVVVLKQGSTFDTGKIHGTVVFQQTGSSTDSTNMRSLCTLIEVAGIRMLTCGDHHCGKKESKFDPAKVGHVDVYKTSHHGLYTGDTESFIKAISPDWILHTGWKSWPIGTIGVDAKTKAAQKAYQKYGNLLPGDVCGRTELTIAGGVITAKGEKNMVGKTVTYMLAGKKYQKTVHVCEKAAFRQVKTMIPRGASIA